MVVQSIKGERCCVPPWPILVQVSGKPDVGGGLEKVKREHVRICNSLICERFRQPCYTCSTENTPYAAMDKLIDRQVDCNAHRQVQSDDHSAGQPDLIGNGIDPKPTEPILRSDPTRATTLLPPAPMQLAHAPHSQDAPQWQSPATIERVGSKTTSSSSSCVQSPCRQRPEVFKAADGTEAPPQVRFRLEKLIDALNSKCGHSFAAAVNSLEAAKFLDRDSLEDELKYLDGTLLENLIHAGSTQIVEYFLRYFQRESFRFINGPNRNGQFDALGVAVSNNDVEMGLLLFEAGARPENHNVPQKFWNELLQKAVAKNRTGSVEALMLHGDPELVRNLRKLPMHDYQDKKRDELNPSRAIIFHLRKGNQKQLTSIFSIMCDRVGPDRASGIFDEFLLLAIKENQLDKLKLLIASKPGEMKSLKPSRSLEHLMQDTALAGKAKALEILLDYHPLIRPKRNDEWAFSGFRNYFDDNVAFSGRAINKEDEHGNTLLHLAAYSGNAATMALLLDRGADARKILEQDQRKLTSPARRGSHSSKGLPAWTLDYLSMKSTVRGKENNDTPRIVQPALSRIANDVAALESALSGRIGGPTAAQSTMVKAGILAQSNPPEFLTGADPYAKSGLDEASVGELDRRLAAWSIRRGEEGEALEAPFRDLIADLWKVISRHDLNDAQIGRVLKVDLIEHGMYGLVADCVVAAFTAAFSHGALDTSEEGRQKSFADALRREIWLNPQRRSQRNEAISASANPVLFDVLMHRQLDAIEQYCEHYLELKGAPLDSN